MFEVIGNSGVFDYIEYVSEYSTWTLPLFDEIGRTMELFPQMSVMIKIEEQARGMVATRAIDAGFQSVMFADIRTADDVRESIRYVRAETPEIGGLHGVNGRRQSGGYGGARGGTATQDWVKSLNDIVVVVMIEKKSAMQNLDEILKRALKRGIQPRVEANDLEEAKKFTDMGVRHMCIGTDLGTIGDWCKQQTKGGIASLLKSL
jgi:4-hydroxy-2-oxoheptanedioate aldolase